MIRTSKDVHALIADVSKIVMNILLGYLVYTINESIGIWVIGLYLINIAATILFAWEARKEDIMYQTLVDQYLKSEEFKKLTGQITDTTDKQNHG